MGPAAVIEQIKASGLRGRGGAGFPTGTKWEFCAGAAGPAKYFICNADLGDHILDSDFHFSVAIKQGAGAFVCGEETALMASIEGSQGTLVVKFRWVIVFRYYRSFPCLEQPSHIQ